MEKKAEFVPEVAAATPDVTDLPAYPAKDSASSETLEYTVSLPDDKGNEWLTLKFATKATGGSPQANKVPRINEGDPVVGSVMLHLRESTTVKSVSIRVCRLP